MNVIFLSEVYEYVYKHTDLFKKKVDVSSYFILLCVISLIFIRLWDLIFMMYYLFT